MLSHPAPNPRFLPLSHIVTNAVSMLVRLGVCLALPLPAPQELVDWQIGGAVWHAAVWRAAFVSHRIVHIGAGAG